MSAFDVFSSALKEASRESAAGRLRGAELEERFFEVMSKLDDVKRELNED